MPSITFSGLASGLDTKAIIDAILSVERRPLKRLERSRQLFNQRKASFDELRSKLNAFETSLRDAGSNRSFRGRTTTVSDESILRASSGTGAEVGLFAVEVTALATASKVRSDGFAASDQGLVGDGQITLQSGSNEAIVIDVSSVDGNNSLNIIRDSINDADQGVRAAIIFDGNDYLLTVRSEETGTANALTITDSTDLNLDSAPNLVSSAADAALLIEDIAVTSSSNKVTGVIPGVTLDLISTTGGTPITVEVEQDNDKVVESVQSLVADYNEIVDFFAAQFDRNNPGPLASDATARNIFSRLQSLFTGGVEGIPFGSIRSLSSVGVSFDGKTGKATLDAAKLREVLDTNFDEVGDLFLSAGKSTDFRIQFVSSTNATVAGTYPIEITQAAEQATVVGSKAITSLNKDENLTITVGSDSTTVLLDKNSDITDVVDAINAALDNDDVAATAIDDGGKLRISTQAYGSAVDITVTSDLNNPPNGKNSGFDTTPATDNGLDVAGSIGGVAGTGNGQNLTAAEGGDYEGLQIKVIASAAAVAATGGDFGTISFSRGLMDSLISTVDKYTQFGAGALDVVRDSLDRSLRSLERDIEQVTARLAGRERQLIQTFTRAEQAIQALNAQQSSSAVYSDVMSPSQPRYAPRHLDTPREES